MTARLPWQPPERRREDKAAGRREWAASRAWRQRVCSGAPAPAPPRPGPRAAAAAAANSSPVRDHSGGHGRNGHSCENKTEGKKGESSQLRQMCREDLETRPRRAGSSRSPPPPPPPRGITQGWKPRWLGPRPASDYRAWPGHGGGSGGPVAGPGLLRRGSVALSGGRPGGELGRPVPPPPPEALHTFPPPTGPALPAAGRVLQLGTFELQGSPMKMHIDTN